MTIRHDPLLALGLAREISRRWAGARAAGLRLHGEAWAAELRFRDAPSLLFLLHPEAGFLLERGPLPGGGGIPFRRLRLGRPWAPPDERLLFLPLLDDGGRERHRIAVELHTNQWNLLLLDPPAAPDDSRPPRIRGLLRRRETAHRTLSPGAPYHPPPGGRRWTTEPPPWEEWRDLLAPVPPAERRGLALREVAWLSVVNADHVLGEAAETAEEAPLREAHGRYLALRETAGPARAAERAFPDDAGPDARPRARPAWLLRRPWGVQPYPVSLGEPDARAVPSLLAGMQEAAGDPEEVARLADPLTVAPAAGRVPGTGPGATREAAPAAGEEEAVRLRRALRSRRRLLRRRRAALRRELAREPRPEELRATGKLLLARLREVPRGASEAALEDFDGAERRVALDPALGPVENAEAYFREAARRERAAARVPGEIARAEASLRQVEEALRALETGAVDESLWEAAGGRRETAARDAEGERLPYLRFRTSGGLEVRVGRNARSNDRLTFHHSAPEDIWLHARQVEGAHVILRWGRREENPPARDLHEAAVAAALHSGARHSGTVAVDWTRRKHVRKPRKAPPGAVLADRVKTLFVEPDPRLVERMRREG